MLYFRWIANAPNNEIKLRIICVFFEMVSRANATRASNGLAPMSFERQDTIMKDVLVKHGVSSEVPYVIPRQNQAGASGNNNNQRKQGKQGNSSKPQQKKERKKAVYNNMALCFAFNSTNGGQCNNDVENGACKNNEGRSFAHRCNKFVKNKNDFCYGDHAKKDHA